MQYTSVYAFLTFSCIDSVDQGTKHSSQILLKGSSHVRDLGGCNFSAEMGMFMFYRYWNCLAFHHVSIQYWRNQIVSLCCAVHMLFFLFCLSIIMLQMSLTLFLMWYNFHMWLGLTYFKWMFVCCSMNIIHVLIDYLVIITNIFCGHLVLYIFLCIIIFEQVLKFR